VTHHGFRVDWSTQFASLEPYADGKGGIVHIHAGSDAPKAAFLRVLRSYLSQPHWAKNWHTVQIDPSDGSTHYLQDIVRQIAAACSIDLSLRAEPTQVATLANHLNADAAITLNKVSITQTSGHSVVELASALKVALSRAFESERLCIIVHESHKFSRGELNGLFSRLWETALQDLIQVGLLIVDIFDPVKMHKRASSWPPAGDLVLELPATYAPADRATAQIDLMRIAMERGIYREEMQAGVFADTLLASATDVRSLHLGLGLALAKLHKS
jgi:hypothetical protein